MRKVANIPTRSVYEIYCKPHSLADAMAKKCKYTKPDVRDNENEMLETRPCYESFGISLSCK